MRALLLQRIKKILLLATNRRYRTLYFSLSFDSRYYLRNYPEAIEYGPDPLVHYLEQGWLEDKRPNTFFDPVYYQHRYKDDIAANTHPLYHYLKSGWQRGFFPSEACAEGALHKQYMEILNQGENPLEYLLAELEEQRVQPPAYFLPDWYHDQVPTVVGDTLALWHHYFDHGKYEGRSPLPVFDPDYYRANNNDIHDWHEDLYSHFRSREAMDGRRPCKWFDPKYYQAKYMHSERGPLTPLEHYLQKGVYSGHYTNKRVEELTIKPVVSIVVPVYNAKPHYLNNCIRSILYQSYPHWQLCLCDDCSTAPHIRQLLAEWEAKDSRITVTYHQQNRGISAATNSAATLASGNYIGFLDNDDELAGDCLYQVVRRIEQTGADCLYTDENLIGDDGRRYTPFYKPAFNRELLLCHNYVTHFVVTTLELFKKMGGFSSEMDGAQDFDLILKLTEQASRVEHIAKILYHWRAAESSTSVDHSQKSYADEAGRNAVQQAMQRANIAGEVLATDWKFYYRVKREVVSEPSVSIIVHLENGSARSRENVTNLARLRENTSTEIVLIYSQPDAKMAELCATLTGSVENCRYLPADEQLSPAAGVNRAAESATGTYLAFISGDVRVRSSDWLNCLLEHAQDDNVGLVGGRLFTNEKSVVVSTTPEISSGSVLYYRQFLVHCSSHLNGLQWPQEVLSVSPELFIVKRQQFMTMGGFDAEKYPAFFMATDLGFRLRQQGYKNIYMPYCEVDWYASDLPVREAAASAAWQAEKYLFQKHWQKVLLAGDPYYHPGCYRDQGISDSDFARWLAGDEPGQVDP